LTSASDEIHQVEYWLVEVEQMQPEDFWMDYFVLIEDVQLVDLVELDV
jgi:hypothetical protein